MKGHRQLPISRHFRLEQLADGVYAAIGSGKAAAKLAGLDVSVLGADLAARGISEEKLADGVKVVDYAAFVDMTTANDKVQSWL